MKAGLIAADVMVSPIVCVDADEKLPRVEGMLVREHVGGAPVTRDGKIVGIISRSDFVRVPVLLEVLDGYVADELDKQPPSEADHIQRFCERFSDLKVAEVMTTQVISCQRDTPVTELAESMVSHHVHRLVVVEGDRPVGIVESLDLVKLLIA